MVILVCCIARWGGEEKQAEYEQKTREWREMRGKKEFQPEDGDGEKEKFSTLKEVIDFVMN